MQNALVVISFRQILDASMQDWFAKGIINSSYEEFLLKSQAYNQEKKFTTFREMVIADGRANSLHYKCGFPVMPYVDLLKNEIPGLKDNTDQPIKFKLHQLHIIDSDITNKVLHKVSVTYYSDTISLLSSFGEFLLLAYGNKFTGENESAKLEDTFLLKIVPQLSFSSFQLVSE